MAKILISTVLGVDVGGFPDTQNITLKGQHGKKGFVFFKYYVSA